MRAIPLLALLLSGCAADRYTDKEMTEYDRRTEYRIEQADDGFTLYVWYSRFQWLGSKKTIIAEGRQKMFNIANEHADQEKRAIDPVNEQRIKEDSGHTFWTTSSWSGVVKVFWKKAGSS